jgi:hypothetical protein
MTKSGQGLIGPNTGLTLEHAFGPNQACVIAGGSVADEVTILGTSSSVHINGNTIQNIAFARSATPSSGVTNILIQHVTGATINNIRSVDAYNLISETDTANVNVTNSSGGWGYNSVTLTASGTYCGANLTGTAGTAINASDQFTSGFWSTNGLGSTIDAEGFCVSGTQISDLTVRDWINYQMNMGYNIAPTGSGFYICGDIHILNAIDDAINSYGIYVHGTNQICQIEVNGGWSANNGGLNSYSVYVNAVNGVSVSNHAFYPTSGNTPYVAQVTSSNLVTFDHNHFYFGPGISVSYGGVIEFTGVNLSAITNNSIEGYANSPSNPLVNLVSGSSLNTITGNEFGGGGNVALSVCSTCNHNHYVNFNNFDTSVFTTSISDSGTDNQLTTASVAFSGILSGTNTTAAMLCGSGCSLGPTGTGTIQATNIASTIAAGTNVSISGSGTTASPYTISSTAGGGAAGTITYTGNHTLGSSDCGALLVFNCSGACALTLPNPQPTTTCSIHMQSVGSSTATITLGSSMTYNGGASVPVLLKYALLDINSNTSTSTDYVGDTPAVAGTNVTITSAANGQTIASSGGGGGGSWQAVESHTASASSTLNFTTCLTTSNATSFEFVFENIVPTTNAVTFEWLFSFNGGSSYDTSALYTWQQLYFVSGTTASEGVNGSATAMGLSGTTRTLSSTAANGGYTGQVVLYNPGNTTGLKNWSGTASFFNTAGTAVQQEIVGGSYNNTSAVNAVQFLMNSGTIASGTIRCYALTH